MSDRDEYGRPLSQQAIDKDAMPSEIRRLRERNKFWINKSLEMEARIIVLGRECTTAITGDPDDAEINFSQAMDAIRACLRLGREAHNKANALQTRLTEAEALLGADTVGSPYWCECRDAFLAKEQL